MKKILLAVIFVTAFSIIRVTAQVFIPQPPAVYIPQLDPVGMHLQQQVFQQMAFGEMYKDMIVNGKKVRVRTSNSRTPPPVKTAKSVTAFDLTGGRILPERLGSTAGKSAADVREAKQTFDMFLNDYEKVALKDGFPANDLAYGFEFFIVTNYNIYNDFLERNPADKALMAPNGDPLLALQRSYSTKARFVTMTAEKAVYQQIKTFLSANPAIVKLTDRQKQEFTEMLAIVSMTNFYMYETAGKNNDAKAFAKAQSAAKQSLENMLSVSADKIKITAKGLEF